MATFVNKKGSCSSGLNHKTGLPPSLTDLVLKPKCKEKISRPLNAFMVYAKEHRNDVSVKNPTVSNKHISTVLGKLWKSLDGSTKQKYYDKAKTLERLHKEKYPDYVYSPKEARIRKLTKKRLKMMKKGRVDEDALRSIDEDESYICNSVDLKMKQNRRIQKIKKETKKLKTVKMECSENTSINDGIDEVCTRKIVLPTSEYIPNNPLLLEFENQPLGKTSSPMPYLDWLVTQDDIPLHNYSMSQIEFNIPEASNTGIDSIIGYNRRQSMARFGYPWDQIVSSVSPTSHLQTFERSDQGNKFDDTNDSPNDNSSPVCSNLEKTSCTFPSNKPHSFHEDRHNTDMILCVSYEQEQESIPADETFEWSDLPSEYCRRFLFGVQEENTVSPIKILISATINDKDLISSESIIDDKNDEEVEIVDCDDTVTELLTVKEVLSLQKLLSNNIKVLNGVNHVKSP